MFITTILVSSSLIAAGDFQIEDVLPSEAVFSCSVENLNHVYESMITKTQREKIYTLMSEAFAGGEGGEMCSAIESQCKELMAQSDAPDDWKPTMPTGYAGFGVYPIADYEAGTVGIAMLAVLELRNPEMAKVAASLCENMPEMTGIQVETINLAGADVWMIDSFLDPNLVAEIPMGFGESLAMDRIYMGSVNGYIICGTDADGVSRAIAATSGEVESDSLASNETYIGMMDQIDEGDLHAVVMLDNLADFITQADESQMVGMFLPILKTVIGDVDGFAESVTVAPSDDVFLNVSYTMWMPNGREGLLGLASAVTSHASAPNFVGDDTVSYSQINVDFEKLAPWISNVMSMNTIIPMPPQQIESLQQGVAEAVAPLGNTMHVLSTLALPLTAESMGFLLAFECKDSEKMETYLSMMMPMTGSEPREFLGYRIYPVELPSAGMMTGGMDLSMSVAVGGGWAMLGMTHSVENALRLAADPNSNKSTSTQNTAMEIISTNDATGWGYADIGKSLLASAELSEMQMVNMIQEMETFDPEMAAEMKQQFDIQMKTSKAINELVASFLGATAWTIEANDDGFVAHAVLMRP